MPIFKIGKNEYTQADAATGRRPDGTLEAGRGWQLDVLADGAIYVSPLPGTAAGRRVHEALYTPDGLPRADHLDKALAFGMAYFTPPGKQPDNWLDGFNIRGFAPVTRAEAKAHINRKYGRPDAWSSGIRTWHSKPGDMVSAITYIPISRSRYISTEYGADESYKLSQEAVSA